MLNVGIIGASGYTGAELLRLLHGHPEVRVTAITSRSYAGRPLGECFPSLGHLGLSFDTHEDPAVLDKAEFFFTALPHKASMGMEEMFAKSMYLPSTSSRNPSSRLIIHHCIGISQTSCLLDRSEK